jgi:hypothetical protein
MEEYIIEPTPALFNSIEGEISRLEALYQAYSTEKKIPKGLQKDHWQVGYCPYKGRGCCGD